MNAPLPYDLFVVQILNDDKTPMAFVVDVLRDVFGKSQQDAIGLMMETHRTGRGNCGAYVRDEALDLVARVAARSRAAGHALVCAMAPAPAEAEKPPDRVVFIGRLTRQEVIAGQVNNVARHILPRVLAFYFGLLIACCTLAILHGGIGQLQSLHMIEFFGGAALALCVLLLVLVELRCWRARDQTSDTAVCLTPDHVSLTRPGDSIVTLPAARFRFYRISQGVVGEFGRKSWIFLPFRVLSADDRGRLSQMYNLRM